jgi:hypothetical protein
LLNYLHVVLRIGCHVNKIVCTFFLTVDDCFFVDWRALSVVTGRDLLLNEARVFELVDGFAVSVVKKLADAFIWLPNYLAFLSQQFNCIDPEIAFVLGRLVHRSAVALDRNRDRIARNLELLLLTGDVFVFGHELLVRLLIQHFAHALNVIVTTLLI